MKQVHGSGLRLQLLWDSVLRKATWRFWVLIGKAIRTPIKDITIVTTPIRTLLISLHEPYHILWRVCRGQDGRAQPSLSLCFPDMRIQGLGFRV